MHQKLLLRLLAHALDSAQCRLDRRLAAQGTVEGDSESVGLIPDALQNLEGLRIAVYEQGVRVPYPYHLLQAFRQTYHRHTVLETKLANCLVREVQLTLASIYHHQLREVVRGLIQHPGIAAVDHLLHRGVVVRPYHSLDFELAVILF